MACAFAITARWHLVYDARKHGRINDIVAHTLFSGGLGSSRVAVCCFDLITILYFLPPTLLPRATRFIPDLANLPADPLLFRVRRLMLRRPWPAVAGASLRCCLNAASKVCIPPIWLHTLVSSHNGGCS